MVRKGYVVLLSLILAACGGGGGGGGSPAPANINPDTNNETNTGQGIKTGIFTDALVSGLYYRQGSVSGVTDDNGTFTYDSKNPEKVVFSIGSLRIGEASGRAQITPFDLDSNNGTANYNRGVNVARLLISMDIDGNPNNGIELPPGEGILAGNLPFDLAPSEFSESTDVGKLLATFHVDNLVTETVALQHMNANPVIIQALDGGKARLAALGKVNIRWNANLNEEGVLADVRANNGERLIVMAGVTQISSALYIDAKQNFVFIRYDQAGAIYSVTVNGKTRKLIQIMNEEREVDRTLMFDLANYRAPATVGLIDVDTGALSPLFRRHAAYVDKTTGFFGRLAESQVGDNDMLALTASLMLGITDYLCDSIKGCESSSVLQFALQFAMEDNEYLNQSISLQAAGADALSLTALCVRITGLTDGDACGTDLLLSNFLSVQYENFLKFSAAWNKKLVTVGDGQDTRILFHYIGHKQKYRPAGYMPDIWNLEEGPVPAPWIEADAEFNTLDKAYRLADGGYYVVRDILSVERPLVFREMAYQLNSNGQYVASRLSTSSDVNTPEREAIRDLMNDLVGSVLQGSWVVYQDPRLNDDVLNPYFGDSWDFINYKRHPTDPVVGAAERFYEAEYALARSVTSGLDRYVDFTKQSINTPAPSDERAFFRRSIVFSKFDDELSIYIRGRFNDPRFRKGYGFFIAG